ncbi:MAG: ribosome silencing factor [[Clostridium] fimetarium]|nr:ribosome silencing factor [Alistipes timonensis]MCM1405820.1 ribosome silencing factor [[Clostridium] fimetarium]
MTDTVTLTPSGAATASEPETFDTYVIDAIQDRKGKEVTIIDLSAIEAAPARKFILCQGTSSQQVASIADHVRDSLLEKHGIKPYNYDGYRNAQWIVIDYGDTLVHVFTREARTLYNLEELWSDAVITAIPDLD